MFKAAFAHAAFFPLLSYDQKLMSHALL